MSGAALSLNTRISLNREEAAAAVGVSPAVFDRMVEAGELPAPFRSQVSRRLFWSVAALEAAIMGARPADPRPPKVDEPSPEDAYEGVKL